MGSVAFAGSYSINLLCQEEGGTIFMTRISDDRRIGTFASKPECLESRDAANEGVVCVYFVPPPGGNPAGWLSPGWTPYHIDRRRYLGRALFKNQADCLAATRAAHGGMVCTNTGLGAMAARIDTNVWCGSSMQLKYCLQSTEAAKDHIFCSFPGDGTGAERRWVQTVVTDHCEYSGPPRSLAECNQTLPEVN